MLKAKVVFNHRYDKDEWGTKQYDYFTFIDWLHEGDLVVVETANGFTVAKFVEYTNSHVTKCEKFIVQKVDLSSFNLEKGRIERIANLNKAIEKKAKEAMNRKLYDELAERDD